MFAHNDKPWDEISGPIDQFLVNVRAYFFKAFCEGVELPDAERTPLELLQKRFFEDVCEDVGRCERLYSLADIDEHFNALTTDAALAARIDEFNRRDTTRKIMQRHEVLLTAAISPAKVNMVKQYIVFHHVIRRMQYFLNTLNQYDNQNGCAKLIALLLQEVRTKNDTIREVKDNAARELLDPFIVLNNFIVDTLTEKKYGEFIINGLLKLDRAEELGDTIYKQGHANLNDLLSINQLAELVQRKITGDAEASRQIAEATMLMHTVMDSLNVASREISRNSHIRFVDYLTHLDVFTQPSEYEHGHQTIKQFMQDLKVLEQLLRSQSGVMISSPGNPDFLLPSLCQAVAAVTQAACAQSSRENNEWKLASVFLNCEAEKLICQIDSAKSAYLQCFSEYDTYAGLMQAFAANLAAAKALKERWDTANYQNLEILRQSAQFLDYVIDLSSQLSEMPSGMVVEYLKRHWPELSGLAATGTAASAVIGVFLVTIPYLVIPGMVVGAGLGMAVSAIRDRVSPPPDKTAPDKSVLQKLQGPEAQVVEAHSAEEQCAEVIPAQPLPPNDNNAPNDELLEPLLQSEQKPADSPWFIARFFSFRSSAAKPEEPKHDNTGPKPGDPGLN